MNNTFLFDLSHDTNNSQLYRLKQLYGEPAFVKSAREEELRPAKKLPDTYYGDPRFSQYPMHSKAATWASYGFFLENVKRGAHRPQDADLIEARILHAGKVYEISKSLGQLKEAIANNRPDRDEELPDSDFALVWHDNGLVERHMRIRNRNEVVKAAAFLQQYGDELVYADRQRAAERILEKAADMGLRLPDETRTFITKQAGYGACTAAGAANLLRGRVAASRKHGQGDLSETQTDMLKLADHLQTYTSTVRNHDMRVKIAGVVDGFDRQHGLTGQVREGRLARLEDVLFDLTAEKLASVTDEFTRLPSGSIYKLADVEKVRLRDVRAMLGDEMADAMSSDGLHVDCTKAAEVLPTLVRHDCEVFDRIMEGYGLKPAMKEAASYEVKIPHAYLQQMAGA